MATKLCRINQYLTLMGWIATNFIISYYGCQKEGISAAQNIQGLS